MSWADELTPEERERYDAWREQHSPTASYADMLAEFGFYYGWDAIKDVLEDNLSARLFMDLLTSGRKFYQSHMLNQMLDTYNAQAATQSKKAFRKFQQLVRERRH